MNLGSKYVIVENQIVNKATGIPIQEDEPVMIFRAKDEHARRAIQAYMHALVDVDHYQAVKQRLAEFEDFAAAQPARMKEPD